jgi:peptidoglycan/LPS O-acetylase OafA/YrhL
MLRAVAALAVVTHHSLEQSNGVPGRFSPDWLTTCGASGVDIFFVISGFIMLHVSFRAKSAPLSAMTFLSRRATRIYPFYWFCCLTMLLASALGFMAHHHWNAAAAGASFLLLPNANPLINVAWTLVYEVYFYLIFAAMLVWRSAGIAVIGTNLAIIGCAAAGFALPDGTVRAFLTNPIPLEFCFGLWLAWGFSIRTEGGGRWPVGPALGVFALLLLAVAPLFVWHPNTSGLPGLPRVLAWGLPSVLLVAAALRIGKPQNAVSRFVVLLGDASYALYLTHVFVMIGYGKLLKATVIGRYDQLWVVPCVIAMAVLIGILAHLYVEQPLLLGVRRLARHQSQYSLQS